MLRIKNEKQVLSKAAITAGSFTSEIGLSEEEADRFIDFVIDESGLKDKVRLIRMDKRTQNIDKLALGSEKVLKPGVAAQDPGETVSISTSQIKLQTEEIVGVVRISDEALEDNIEGDAFADHLLGLIARASSNQIEDALLFGSKTLQPATPTEITQLWNGWITQAKSGGNIVDAAGAGFGDRFIEREKLSKLVKAMPTKFRKNKRNMNFTMSDDIDQDWSDVVLAGRATALGDAALQGDAPNRYRSITFQPSGLIRVDRPVAVSGGGSEVLSNNESIGDTLLEMAGTDNFAVGDKVVLDQDSAIEEVRTIASVNAGVSITVDALVFAHASGAPVLEVTDDGTDVLFADYRNLIMGVHREMTIEPDRLPRLRATDWVFSMRLVAEVEELTALALLQNLKVK